MGYSAPRPCPRRRSRCRRRAASSASSAAQARGDQGRHHIADGLPRDLRLGEGVRDRRHVVGHAQEVEVADQVGAAAGQPRDPLLAELADGARGPVGQRRGLGSRRWRARPQVPAGSGPRTNRRRTSLGQPRSANASLMPRSISHSPQVSPRLLREETGRIVPSGQVEHPLERGGELLPVGLVEHHDGDPVAVDVVAPPAHQQPEVVGPPDVPPVPGAARRSSGRARRAATRRTAVRRRP